MDDIGTIKDIIFLNSLLPLSRDLPMIVGDRFRPVRVSEGILRSYKMGNE